MIRGTSYRAPFRQPLATSALEPRRTRGAHYSITRGVGSSKAILLWTRSLSDPTVFGELRKSLPGLPDQVPPGSDCWLRQANVPAGLSSFLLHFRSSWV